MKKNCCSQERTGLRDQTRCQEIANQILKHGVDEDIRFGQMTVGRKDFTQAHTRQFRRRNVLLEKLLDYK